MGPPEIRRRCRPSGTNLSSVTCRFLLFNSSRPRPAAEIRFSEDSPLDTVSPTATALATAAVSPESGPRAHYEDDDVAPVKRTAAVQHEPPQGCAGNIARCAKKSRPRPSGSRQPLDKIASRSTKTNWSRSAAGCSTR